ncbi:MAG: tRNA (N6-isopentenyl adenosine(37)-C2)-methylthiotransferase MiaB [Schleiferiaceae bacterium]|jgi:tRNA-2-methylthio-N6-dimethylallyladenosine synthase|nr:tRNA (N6-isopentenyl adenosine(37)-C2)-methylthiotransferase MiaB [Schleiferiaceae bacterium]MDP4628053.1 tRNA (N6-isopentenyl adenosine(37)-C2)-methylthiotransferase MiaB [Schleiferiaceae bacterium]MDP4749384.1 tRNA (N6-isopentenyl adenosine(37)-C2)-methylthiotransferase MiaB [Schleiferiaceae bacterium]MDP4859014.1 tRNA (N6-isopentenyl adenosine(37)-C2)-methylthiotransferase MiaB [Schleiferiaceae bacterium]MDP4900315.1 tRNA (N6-isopentenyl adenosine(37)-C2)-methylthiotransferase MiaB [Schle
MNTTDQHDETRQGEALVQEGTAGRKKLYLESYGCQMNFSDSEIVASLLQKEGYETTNKPEEADLVLLNTCSIRDKAEQTVRKRLHQFNTIKAKKPGLKVGVLGCMAERVREKFFEEEKLVDLVVGPDAYRDLPNLLDEIDGGRKAVNVLLSKEETYDDIEPVRLGGNGVSAFVSITRGCDNMCTFCVVPFTRGRERSRNPQTIVDEVLGLWEKGYKEVTLLGQNVDSYLWYGGGLKKDFEKASSMAQASAVRFADLLHQVAVAVPHMRIRFSTSNPQDMSDDVLHAIAAHPNICKYIHLPVQSGSSRILKAMNRGHNREEYLALVDRIRTIIPGCGLSQDLIAGFPGETEEDHAQTLSLMDCVKYDFGFMFFYSERPNTYAARKLVDDIPLEVKKRRLAEIIERQQQHSLQRNQAYVGQVVEVLVEGPSKKSPDDLFGRTTQNTVVVFPKKNHQPGDFVQVLVDRCTPATLLGESLTAGVE